MQVESNPMEEGTPMEIRIEQSISVTRLVAALAREQKTERVALRKHDAATAGLRRIDVTFGRTYELEALSA
jgi:hypothetical protein